MDNEQRTQTMNTDPFTYQIIRTYNLSSKRDIVKRYDSYVVAQTTMQVLNIQAAGTSYRYHVESKPRKKAGK
jgi:phosphoribosylformylglycinamidine (FGAM) synthase-like enzyme